LALVGSRRWQWIDGLVLLVVGWQAASHLRHGVLLVIAALVLLPGPLTDALRAAFPQLSQRWSGSHQRSWRLAAVAAVMFLLVAFPLKNVLTLWQAGIHPLAIAVSSRHDSPGVPVRAVRFLAQHDLRGPLVTEYGWAQFVLWQRFPEHPVAFDGRYRTVYPAELERQFLELTLGVAPDRTPLLDDWPTQWALFRVGGHGAANLAARRDWRAVYRDDQAVVFQRCRPELTAPAERCLPDAPAVFAAAEWLPFPAGESPGTVVADVSIVRSDSLGGAFRPVAATDERTSP
jgi:hypothetical protein